MKSVSAKSLGDASQATRLISRRQFVSALSVGIAGAAAGCAVTGKRSSSPLVGSQLYGWGQYYQREGKNLADHLDEVLSALRDAGYDYAEGSMDSGSLENNLKFADRCRAKGLKPVALYTGGRLHEAGAAAQAVERLLTGAKACAEAGFSVINCNPDPIGRDKTDAELATQANALSEFGAGLRKLGLRLGVHNHTPEMRNNAREFHWNFRDTPPADVGFCFDVDWVHRGGVAPMNALQKYGGRVVSWHLRQSRQRVWWEDLDTGDIEYDPIARYARERRLAAPLSVELALEQGTKITRSVVENHRRSREFVRRVFGAW